MLGIYKRILYVFDHVFTYVHALYLVCKCSIRAVRQELRHRVRQAVETGPVQRRILVVTVAAAAIVLSRGPHTHTSVP